MHYLCNNRSEVVDMLVYTFGYAPNFPVEDNMNLERAFEELEYGFSIITKTKNEKNLRVINQAHELVKQGYQCYKENENKEGGFLLQDAEALLRGM